MDTQFFADAHLAELHGGGAAIAKSAFMGVDLSKPIEKAQLLDIFASLAPIGYLGGAVPKDEGGSGLGAEEFGAVLEGVSEIAPYLSNHNLQREIAVAGTDALKERWLEPLLTGKAIGTIAITEPTGGSDLGHMNTRVTEDGDGYRITGRKLFAAHTMTADAATVLAEGPGGEAVRVVVDLNHESVRREMIPMSGLKFMTFGLLEFNNTPLSGDDFLLGQGMDSIQRMLAVDRALVAIQATSIAQRAIYTTVKQLSTRSIRGSLVTQTDVTRAEIGRLSASVEAARVLAYHALRFVDEGQSGVEALAAGAKANANDVAGRVTAKCIELTAAEGLITGFELLRLRDDLQMLAIGHGTPLVNAIKWGQYVIDSSQLRRQ